MDERNPVRVAVVGEFNSGKSALVNLLLRRNLLESTLEPSNVPPLHVELLDTDQLQGTTSLSVRGGSDWEKVSAMPIRVTQMRETDEVSTVAPTADFSDVVLTEVSVSENGTLTDQAAAAIDEADFIIWCTMAQRAWCLSEIHIIEGIRRDILDKSILVINRADYLDEAARSRVVARVGDLSSEFFKQLVLVDTSARVIKGASDDDVWETAGGAKLFDLVQKRIVEIREGYEPAPTIQAVPSAPIAQVVPAPETEPAPAPVQAAPEVARPAPAAHKPYILKDAPAIAHAWAEEFRVIQELYADVKHVPAGTLHTEIKARLDGIISVIPSHTAIYLPLARSFKKAQRLLSNREADDMIAVILALELRDRFCFSYLPHKTP
ncbi:dynamin family protein [Celeribacter litoreus]|uniref:dynamin family protein n=1 Tax=Celeribacter litoreus TaxID=2876714 RepID=UPI001CCCFAF8|nr:dynamin family protein [Celeribacter litoreus]